MLLALISAGCGKAEDHLSDPGNLSAGDPSVPDQWFRQADVDLGEKISILSPQYGFAITSGRGAIRGKVLRFRNGTWEEIASHPYSDYPLIAPLDTHSLVTITHLTHYGNYKPVMELITGSKRQNLPIQLNKWDDIDYAMYKAVWHFGNREFLAAGQQGYIAYYDGENWTSVNSPVKKDTLKTLLSGDINALFMFSRESGWAVGKDGMILKCENGTWRYFTSPTRLQLNSIFMSSEDYGIICGDNGTLLELKDGNWKKVELNSSERLTAVKAIDKDNFFIVGTNSSLFHLTKGRWFKHTALSIFEDSFNDLEVIKDSSGKFLIWLIGEEGIYSNASSIGFSFTNITQRAGLPSLGKYGLFIPSEDNFPDLLIVNEGAKATYLRNEKEKGFTPEQISSGFINTIDEAFVSGFGDINRDGQNDIFLLQNSKKFNLLYGSGKDEYIFHFTPPQLKLKETEIYSLPSVNLIDLDNDRFPEIYISIADDQDQLFQNGQGRKFTDIISGSGINKSISHRSYGPLFSDFNNDGLADIFIPYNLPKDGSMGELYINKGNLKFEPDKQDAFLLNSNSSLATTVAISFDANNDGLTDILLHHQKEHPYLFINDGYAKFHRAGSCGALDSLIFHPEPLNGFMGSADFNNDGWMDILIGSRLLINNKNLTFTDVNKLTGFSFSGNPSFADIDDDGDIDIFVGSSKWSFGKGERTALFRNNLNPSAFYKIIPVPSLSNSLSGTAVYITAFKEGKRIYRQKREMWYGNAPMFSQPANAIILADSPGHTYEVEVVFPSGIRKITNLGPKKGSIEIYEENTASAFLTKIFRHLSNKFVEMRVTEEAGKIMIIISQFILLAFFAKNKLIEIFFIRSKVFLFTSLVVFLLLNLSFSSLTFFSKNLLPFFCFIPSFWGFVLIKNSLLKRDKDRHLSQYRIEEKIGEGATCKVFSAYDIINKRRVALKVMNKEIMDMEENRKRFNHEGAILSKLDSRFIAKIYEYGEFEKKSFIAQELLTGGTLREYISFAHPIPSERLKEILISIASGLAEIHKSGIVHRDLKSTNILLDTSGNARITDFGLSRSSLMSSFTSTGTILGTLGFCSPEQITGNSVDHRSDIFSFGVIMYELASNKLPFSGENEISLIHSIFNDIPAELKKLNPLISDLYQQITNKCLEKNPVNRFADTEELLLSLKKL